MTAGAGRKRRATSRGGTGGAGAKAAEPKARSSRAKARGKGKSGARGGSPIVSMTGYGKAALASKRFHGSVEIRSFNHRHLKLALKVPTALSGYEAKIEQLVRDHLDRGSVSLTIKLAHAGRRTPYRFDEDIAEGYVETLVALAERFGLEGRPTLELVTGLPEVLVPVENEEPLTESEWRSIRKQVAEALQGLIEMRRAEGDKLARDVGKRRRDIERSAKKIAKLAPQVATAYRDRLAQRVSQLLESTDTVVEPADIAREVALFADRCDISEELARLESHLEQFDEIVESGREAGRRLEFILHEMFRETNTIGAKANDSGISHLVVEIKAEIEKIREQVQNIE